MQTISLIAALDRQGGIGLDGKIPWHLPEDLARFKQITMGRPIIMGRKTYESIGRPLPGRRNIVITSQRDYEAPGCDIVHSLDQALRLAGEGEVFVIGGATLYQEALPRAHRLYLTHVDGTFSADTFFPEFDAGEWSVCEHHPCPVNDRNAWSCVFTVLEPISK